MNNGGLFSERSSTRKSKQYSNIMHDPRVFRGSTTTFGLRTKKKKTIRKRTRKPKKQQPKIQIYREYEFKDDSDEEDESNTPIDLSTFLEEKVEKPRQKTVSSQTLKEKKKKKRKKYIPLKTGIDTATQVTGLFNFDKEAKPVVENFVDKTLEQSLLEVLHEEEISGLKARQTEIRAKKSKELKKIKEMEMQELKLYQEKEERLKKQRILAKERELRRRSVHSYLFAKRFTQMLKEKVLTNLEYKGFFRDETKKKIEKEFFPVLETKVDKKLEANRIIDGLLDNIL